MFFCIGTEGSNGSLFRNGWFQCFSVWEDRKSVVQGKSVDLGGRRIIKKKKKEQKKHKTKTNKKQQKKKKKQDVHADEQEIRNYENDAEKRT